MNTKKELQNAINCLILSCLEGISGTWDCSTDEGKESFKDMIIILEEIKKTVSSLNF